MYNNIIILLMYIKLYIYMYAPGNRDNKVLFIIFNYMDMYIYPEFMYHTRKEE